MVLFASLDSNIQQLYELYGESSDLNINRFETAGVRCCLASLEGMIASRELATMIYAPLRESFPDRANAIDLFKYMAKEGAFSNEQKVYGTFEEATDALASGFALLFVMGVPKAVGVGVAGYSTRSVSSPDGESDVMGTKEALSDSIKVSCSMIRRRVKSIDLCIDKTQAGKQSKTSVALVYMKSKANKETVEKIKKRVEQADLDLILTSGNLVPFISSNRGALFSSVTSTERPDVIIAKINEGRIALLIDGIPHALVCPGMLVEHFQAVDDYAVKPAYACYVRWIRYLCFFVSVLLPATYVAAATYHPEALSRALLINLIAGEESTPFPLLVEMLIIIILFEVLREAGLRLPKTIGGAVSILGGLVIGDAAVTSGIIPAPLLIIIGITATCSFVVPSLHEQMALLRLINVLAAGFFGFFGMALTGALTLVNACVTDSYALPFTAPVTPFTKRTMGDIVTRQTFKKLRTNNINDFRGSANED